MKDRKWWALAPSLDIVNKDKLSDFKYIEKVTLNNGMVMPTLGIGTFLIEPPDAERGVREALKMGYRHIDTANMYGNERRWAVLSNKAVSLEKISS